MTSRRITIVATEILGRPRTGGAGTADSLLAVALGRRGHRIELLVAPGRPIGDLSAEWAEIYDSAGVSVRVLEQRQDVRPPFLGATLEVFHRLRAEPPDVVVANDWRGLAYAALRARSLGLALSETAFVIHCHGPSRMLAEFAGKVPDRLARFGQEVTERASIELADAVVSPSTWLLDWMRERGWPVPASARVAQYLGHSAALGKPPVRAPSGHAVRRLAFFGQLREGKGIRLLLSSLNALEEDRLDGVELVFLGLETRRWSAAEIAASLDPRVKERVAAIRLETTLDRSGALEQLLVPGTLALMPSLLDNSPNTVSECIERGIPFLAARTGGIPELVAEADRERVLFEPSPDALAARLRAALTSADGVAPARPARDPQESLKAWLEVVAAVAPSRPSRAAAATRVDVLATGEEGVRRARRLAERTRSVDATAIHAESRRAALAQAAADWVLFLDDEDVPDDELLDTLVAAQAAANADVVTAAVRPNDAPDCVHVFLGDPGSLGLVENHYGVLALVRRELLGRIATPIDGVDLDWRLLALLALQGARIVSVPEPLSVHAGKIGQIGDVPGDGLSVLRLFEQADGAVLADLPRLAATLAAAHARLPQASYGDDGRPKHILRRSSEVLRAEGLGGLVRRAIVRIRNMLAR
jgi:glycosyltransferase involved in cell wall biosynthesis